MIVAKFGSSSLQNINHFKTIKEKILSEQHSIIVVSALGGNPFGKKTTDTLIDIYQEQDEVVKKRLIKEFIEFHQKVVDELKIDINLKDDFRSIESILRIGTYQQCLSIGEYISGKILAEYFEYTFIDAKDVILFKDKNKIDVKKSVSAIKAVSKEFNKCLIPGFYGSYNGEINIFTRGGSDITAAIVAYAMDVSVYENWKDTNGIYKDDNGINKDYYEYLTYDEYYALINANNLVIHKEAIDIASSKEIPIRVCSVNTLETGTIIHRGYNYGR